MVVWVGAFSMGVIHPSSNDNGNDWTTQREKWSIFSHMQLVRKIVDLSRIKTDNDMSYTISSVFVWTLKDLLCLRKSWSDGPIACSIVPDLPSLGSSCNHGGMAPTTVIKTYSPTYTDNNTVTNRRWSIVFIFNYLCEHFHCWKNPAIQKEIILVKYFIIWQVTYSWRENIVVMIDEQRVSVPGSQWRSGPVQGLPTAWPPFGRPDQTWPAHRIQGPWSESYCQSSN